MTDSTNLFATADAWYPSAGPYFWQSLGVRALPPWVIPNYISSGFMYLRKNARTKAFVDAVLTDIRASTALDGGEVPSGPDADQPIVNEALDAMRRADTEGSHPVPSTLLTGRPGCANYGPFSFLVLSPHLFQSAAHTQELQLTEAAREPPFLRHFNSVPATLSGSTASAQLQTKVAMMKKWGAWSLDLDTEAVLLCKGMSSSGGARSATQVNVMDGGAK